MHGQGKSAFLFVVGCTIAACTPGGAGEEPTGETTLDIIGGTVAGPGVLEAAAYVPGGCTATLISRWALVTAGHCVCDPDDCAGIDDCYPGWCAPSFPSAGTPPVGSLTFEGVFTPSSPTVRTNADVSGEVFVHPAFSWPSFSTTPGPDIAVVVLDDPIETDAFVTPIAIPMTPITPLAGDSVTIAGYGDCTGGVRTWADVEVSSFGWELAGTSRQEVIVSFADPLIGLCHGDSGGPMILDGRVIGVASTASPSAPYDGSYVATFPDDDSSDPLSETYRTPVRPWIEKYKCPVQDPADDSTFCDDPFCPCQSGEGSCSSDTECLNELGPPPLGPVLRACVEDIGSKMGLPAASDVCWWNALTVKLYSGASFSGLMQQRPEGTWTSFAPLTTIGTSAPSSIKVPPAYAARLCTLTLPPAAPTCTSFFGDVASLPSPHNDNVASVDVQPGARFYSSSSSVWKPPGAAKISNSAEMEPAIGGPVTSLAIAPGILVERCATKTTCGGVRYVKDGPIGGVPPVYWRISKGVTLYSGRGFTGSVDGLPAGSWTASNLNIYFGATEITSLVVAPGMQANICWGPADCRTFTGWAPHVDMAHTDRGVTSIVVSALP
ncbi:MAG TPA: trypsin-like serine protease [Myxococcota bacterium]|jgi:hypothetical protein|nr:trypsin-like serine protease [Myxococcota bacterium]